MVWGSGNSQALSVWEQRQTPKRRARFPEGWRGPGQQDCCLGLCEERTEEGNCLPPGLPLVDLLEITG